MCGNKITEDVKRCMFCREPGDMVLVMTDASEAEYYTRDDPRWYMCYTHAERVKEGLGLFFMDLMLKSETER